jgi:DDE superfamily endonuclease
MPKCSAYPGPLSIVILNNTRIHHNNEILVLTDHFGMQIEYLPPYSPNLNPIEDAFSKVKHFLRRNVEYHKITTGDGILYNMYKVLDVITSSNAEGYFMHARYF